MGEDRHSRYRGGHARRICRAVRPDHAARVHRHGPGPGVRLRAALVNGTASHALDFDDCSNTLGGHPSVPILPGLFALADAMPVSGRDFLAAYVAGFETETRIARAVNFHHYDKGWHPTATLAYS